MPQPGVTPPFVGPGVGGPGPGYATPPPPGVRATNRTIAAQIIARGLARELRLSPKESARFTQDFVADVDRLSRRSVPGQRPGSSERLSAINRKTMRQALERSLDRKEADRAEGLVGPHGFSDSVEILLEQGVPTNRVEAAVPVLIQYHRQAATLDRAAPRGTGQPSTSAAAARIRELRSDTVRQLEPIVGDASAAAWARTLSSAPREGQPSVESTTPRSRNAPPVRRRTPPPRREFGK